MTLCSDVAPPVVCLAFQVSEAQNRKAGINAAAFLKIGVGARQVGLGSAVTAVSGDVNNMFWNPAGIALARTRPCRHRSPTISGSPTSRSRRRRCRYNLEDIGTIGVGFMMFGLSGIPADRDVYPGNAALEALQIDEATQLDLRLPGHAHAADVSRATSPISSRWASP